MCRTSGAPSRCGDHTQRLRAGLNSAAPPALGLCLATTALDWTRGAVECWFGAFVEKQIPRFAQNDKVATMKHDGHGMPCPYEDSVAAVRLLDDWHGGFARRIEERRWDYFGGDRVADGFYGHFHLQGGGGGGVFAGYAGQGDHFL